MKIGWLNVRKNKEGTIRMYDFIFEISEILEKDLNEYLEGMKKWNCLIFYC